MEPLQLLLAAAVVCIVAAIAFFAWVQLSGSREARVYRRRWKEMRLKRNKRDTSKYKGEGVAGFGASAKDRRVG